MARTSTVRNRSVVGPTREAKIAALISTGYTNEAILDTLSHDQLEIIELDDPRRDKKHKKFIHDLPPFDAIARQRAQEAIRSTRKQDRDQEAQIDDLMDATGPRKGVRPLSESQLENLHRFASGVPAIDYIYGTSRFVHLEDDVQGGLYFGKGKPRWYKGDPMLPDGHGGFYATREDSGHSETLVLKRGEEAVTRRKYNLIHGLDKTKQLTEHGMPESFLSIWGGSPGVGKSRLAVSVCKALNGVERSFAERLGIKPRPIMYYNGEAAESQFTQWAGVVDPELFLAAHDENIRLETMVQDIYEYQPRLIVVDSLQMIAEVKKSPSRGAMMVMSRLKQLKVDPKAGMPHIVFISQLNKQEELAGSRYLEHMVDFAAKATRYEGRKGTFLFECTNKNRGGETPRGAIFRHQEDGIECLSTDLRTASHFKLVQPTAPVVVPALTNNQAPRNVDHHGAIV